MSRAVTCTDPSAPRPGEQDGVDYHFLEAGEFLRRLQSGNFMEHAIVYGNSYGHFEIRSCSANYAREKDVLLNAWMCKAQQQSAKYRRRKTEPELKRALVTMFLTDAIVGSFGRMAEEMRQADEEAVIKKRLAVAKQEVAQWKNFN